MSCPTCGSEQTPDAKFCDQCGARMAALCVGCGAELRAGARFCSDCGTRQDEQTPPPSPAPPASAVESAVAERRVTNVLFGDLVGFTSLSETRDHEEVRELLSMYFDRCRRIVGRYGGTVEKFIGDAVMAVWGVPTAHGDDAERAVRAGVELVRAVESIGDELGVAGLTLRVGIVTGEVAVTLGAQYEGMVAGDAVNTAARVQAAATPGEVWVDESTRLLTSGAVTYVDAGSHQLKGKIEPVPLWAVRAVVAGVGGAQRADGLEAPLTGRARELRLVKDLFHGVEESGRPALVLVDGEPGVGKSRLGWEFEKYVDGLRVDFRWHSTRCPAYGDGVAFWPIAEAVRGRLGLIEADPDADALGALDVWLARCVTDEEEAAWLRPRVLALLGSNTTGGFDRDDLFAAWRTFFERAREGLAAVVLLIDDAHHADDGTVGFVEHVLANSDEPLFVMLMARPELLQRWPSLATNRHATVFHLGALDGAEMAELFDGLVSGLPREVRDGLVERAHGVPLYAIETVRSLIDRDLVVPRGGVYVLPDPSMVDLESIGAPASLQALVAARLDSLSASQRRVVTDASVLGVTFTREGIEALAHDVDDLDGTLPALVRLEILSVVGSRLSAEYGQYRFVQSVVRQVAYGTQSRRDRKARHIAVARYFESGEDASGGGFAPILAQHYLDAIAASADNDEDVPDLRASAVEHLVRAAEHARAVGAPGEAQRYLETALAHADAAANAQIHLDAAWAAYEAGDLASVLGHTDAAGAGFGAVGDAIGAGGAAAVRAQALNRFGADNAAALDVAFPHWEALHGVAGAEHVLLHLARAIGSARFALNQDAADVTLERIRIAEAIGDRATLADALVSLGLVHMQKTPTLGAILIRAGVDIARAQQRHRTVSRGLGNLASIASGTSLPDVAMLLDESIEATRKCGGDRYLENTMAINRAILSCLTGAWQRAEELLDGLGTGSFEGFIVPFIDAMISEATGRPRRYPTRVVDDRNVDDEVLLAYCAAADVMDARLRADVEEAAARAVEAVERVVPGCGLSDDTVYIWPYAAEAAIAAGDPEALARVLAPIDDAPPGLLGAALRAHRRRCAGLIAIRDGAADAVEPNLRASIAGFDEWGSPVYRARAQAELAQWLETQGRTEDAAPLRRAALDLFESLGAAGWLAQLGWDRTADATPTTVAGA